MRLAFCLVIAAMLAVPAAAQTAIQHPPAKSVARRPIPVSPLSVFAAETPESCAARNAFLKQKVAPSLQQQLAQLQATLHDRREKTFTCSPDLKRSITGNGNVTVCGMFKCNPIDGQCRSWAKTSDDCDPAYGWDGYRSCTPF